MKMRSISRFKKTIIISGAAAALLAVGAVIFFTRDKNTVNFKYGKVEDVVKNAGSVLGNTYQNFTLPDDFELCFDEKLYTFTAIRDAKADPEEKIRELSQKLYGEVPDNISPYDSRSYDAEMNVNGESVDFIYYTSNTFGFGYGRNLSLSSIDGCEKYLLGYDSIDGVSYRLADGDMKVSEAVDLAYKHIKENLMEFLPSNSDVKARTVTVFKSEKNDYCYCLTFENVFEGVPISSVGQICPDEEFMRPQYIECWIYRTDRVEYTWNKYYLNIKDKEQVKKIITLESALEHLEKELAPYSSYKFLDISLEYCSRANESNADEFDFRPMWCFTVQSMIGNNANTDLRKVIYLDAVTGEIFCYNSETGQFVF